jgi:hypothetical protein
VRTRWLIIEIAEFPQDFWATISTCAIGDDVFLVPAIRCEIIVRNRHYVRFKVTFLVCMPLPGPNRRFWYCDPSCGLGKKATEISKDALKTESS